LLARLHLLPSDPTLNCIPKFRDSVPRADRTKAGFDFPPGLPDVRSLSPPFTMRASPRTQKLNPCLSEARICVTADSGTPKFNDIMGAGDSVFIGEHIFADACWYPCSLDARPDGSDRPAGPPPTRRVWVWCEPTASQPPAGLTVAQHTADRAIIKRPSQRSNLSAKPPATDHRSCPHYSRSGKPCLNQLFFF
jgi:hypothetical protein